MRSIDADVRYFVLVAMVWDVCRVERWTEVWGEEGWGFDIGISCGEAVVVMSVSPDRSWVGWLILGSRPARGDARGFGLGLRGCGLVCVVFLS